MIGRWRFRQAVPNDAHHALARLEARRTDAQIQLD
jgi:hypothetical protein